MKAAVFHGSCDIRTEQVPDPVLEPHAVIIKVKACGICGSDLHIFKQDSYKGQDFNGTIFGHEFSGEVAAVGKDVTGISVGERVTAVGFRPCGKCFWCGQGKPHRCSDMALLGYQFPGAMAEYVSVPFAAAGRNVFRLPEELTYEDGACVEPLSISLFSVKRGQPGEKDIAIVLGLGVIGLNAVQVLKAMGVPKVFASGRRPTRLAVAKGSGAEIVADAASEDVMAVLSKATQDLGATLVVECAGVQETFDQSVDLARGAGRVLLVGVYEKPLVWDPAKVMGKNLNLIGCLGGNFPGSIELLKNGKVNAKPYVTHRFSLDEIAKAFQTQIKDPNAIKVMIVP